jgi:hypothetical protein
MRSFQRVAVNIAFRPLNAGELAPDDIFPATIEDPHPVTIQSGQRR